MEREQLLRALAAWRDGIDPLHGSVLPPDHPAQRADFLRVVCAAIDAIARSDVAHRSAGSTGRANAGRPWSHSEDALLTQAHAAGMSVAELARAHGRTNGAITARLVKLELIAMPSGLRLRELPSTASSP